MRDVFQAELREVQDRLVEIAELVERAITTSTRAFATSDIELANEVIGGDRFIDQRATALDELAIDILVRQQPVAGDLRLMVSALRMSASLERMGDIAEHIALFARYRFPEAILPESLVPTFTRMAELDVAVSENLTQLLRTLDLHFAMQIRDLDDEIDELHASVFEAVLSRSFEGDSTAVVDATLASRYHERFADHAVSITKKVTFLVSGEYE